jgi:diguanylate cyclase (GGDEF)-like protein
LLLSKKINRETKIEQQIEQPNKVGASNFGQQVEQENKFAGYHPCCTVRGGNKVAKLMSGQPCDITPNDVVADYLVVAAGQEERFDDLTRLAAYCCGTRIAAISLADKDRFFIKSLVGAELPETAYEDLFCAHAVKEPDLLVVPDASSDTRFANHPFVTSTPYVRFYAGAPLIAPSGHVVGTLCVADQVVRDLNDSQKQVLKILARQVIAQLELRSQSIHDPLTGLLNRRFLFEMLERELSRMARKLQPLGLIMLDLDHFKRVNDKFGHEAGDVVLKTIAQILRRNTRREDFACRFGGEEFILVLPETPLAITHERAEEVLQAIREIDLKYNGQSLEKITASAGTACYLQHETSPLELLRRADEALYGAKAAGRDQMMIGQPE